jgi:hypothetical protein
MEFRSWTTDTKLRLKNVRSSQYPRFLEIRGSESAWHYPNLLRPSKSAVNQWWGARARPDEVRGPPPGGSRAGPPPPSSPRCGGFTPPRVQSAPASRSQPAGPLPTRGPGVISAGHSLTFGDPPLARGEREAPTQLRRTRPAPGRATRPQRRPPGSPPGPRPPPPPPITGATAQARGRGFSALPAWSPAEGPADSSPGGAEEINWEVTGLGTCGSGRGRAAPTHTCEGNGGSDQLKCRARWDLKSTKFTNSGHWPYLILLWWRRSHRNAAFRVRSRWEMVFIKRKEVIPLLTSTRPLASF